MRVELAQHVQLGDGQPEFLSDLADSLLHLVGQADDKYRKAKVFLTLN